ncbi:MAG TPA: hypothetical protein VEQ58_06360 [Polyangiaceae bacterium]|nr:hypothetical protein [Polyangiaceae bacterium]
MSGSKLVWLPLLGALACVACGGNVNLGGKPGPSSEPDGNDDEPTGPDAPVGKSVAVFPDPIRVNLMAVAGDYLYVGNDEGLSRCLKRNCIPTLELVPNVAGSLNSLQVYEDRLAVTHSSTDELWFADYSLPLGARENVVIRDLPPLGSATPLWHGGFLYWHLNLDSKIYRCALPSCATGPELVGSYLNDTDMSADGEMLFWFAYRAIYRSPNRGGGPVVALLPDATLSEAPPEALVEPLDTPLDMPTALTTSAGMLYVALARAQPNPPTCGESCPHSIMRWPVEGGAGEELFTSNGAIDRMYAFGGELIWHDIPSTFRESTLWSCLADNCVSTRRKLGQVSATQTQVVADDTSVYWLEAVSDGVAFDGSMRFANGAIHRAPRLSPE